MPSIRQIALKAGVSPATVSSVLNGKEKERRIKPASADKIRKIAVEEGYVPNQVAINLRTGK
ncbi:MAG: LacI family DNA-binding transcriptional regulator, partial [Flavihumibacter sp.]